MIEKTTLITQYLEIVIHSSLVKKNASNEVQSPWYSTLFVLTLKMYVSAYVVAKYNLTWASC